MLFGSPDFTATKWPSITKSACLKIEQHNLRMWRIQFKFKPYQLSCHILTWKCYKSKATITWNETVTKIDRLITVNSDELFTYAAARNYTDCHLTSPNLTSPTGLLDWWHDHDWSRGYTLNIELEYLIGAEQNSIEQFQTSLKRTYIYIPQFIRLMLTEWCIRVPWDEHTVENSHSDVPWRCFYSVLWRTNADWSSNFLFQHHGHGHRMPADSRSYGHQFYGLYKKAHALDRHNFPYEQNRSPVSSHLSDV